MATRKRGNVWYYDVYEGSKRRVKSSGSSNEEDAKRLEAQAKALHYSRKHNQPITAMTFDGAIVRWLEEKKGKKDISGDARMLAWWLKVLGAAQLDMLTGEVIEPWLERKAQETSESRANRYASVLRSVLRRAATKWKWLQQQPYIPRYKEKAGRTRSLRPEEVTRLLAELPPHLKPVVQFAFATGLRHSNVMNLRWPQIDLKRNIMVIPAGEMKNDDALGLPLNEDAQAALAQCKGKHAHWVFTYRGERLGAANKRAWRKALVRAGIEDFRFHDNRHTWATTLRQRGVPLDALLRMGGWKDMKMVLRYAHLFPDDLHQYAAKGNGLTTAPAGD